jgi:hypothetical protein
MFANYARSLRGLVKTRSVSRAIHWIKGALATAKSEFHVAES